MLWQKLAGESERRDAHPDGVWSAAWVDGQRVGGVWGVDDHVSRREEVIEHGVVGAGPIFLPDKVYLPPPIRESPGTT